MGEDLQLDGGAEGADGEETARVAERRGEERRGGRCVGNEGEAARDVSVGRAGRADAPLAEEGEEAGEGAGELVGGDLGGAEEGELAAARAVGVRGEDEAGDGGAGGARVEALAEEGEERLRVARGAGEVDR